MSSSAAGGGRQGKSQTRRPSRRVGIVSAWIIGSLGVVGVTLAALITTLGGHSPTVDINLGGAGQVTHSASPAAIVQATGSFSYPKAGPADLSAPATLTARGIVRHLEPGHHLLLFMQDGSIYWAGDADVVISQDGRWSGTICLGFQADNINLYLVDIGPAGLARLKSNNGAFWSSKGMKFPPVNLASDVSVLSSVPVHANGNHSQCTASEPEFY